MSSKIIITLIALIVFCQSISAIEVSDEIREAASALHNMCREESGVAESKNINMKKKSQLIFPNLVYIHRRYPRE